jgi:chondroitin AC lyase
MPRKTLPTICSVLIVLISGASAIRNDRSPLVAKPIAAPKADRDIPLINERLTALYVGGKYSGADRYLAAQAADGGWQDIDYNDQSNAWPPLNHLARLQEMAIAYRSPDSSDRRSTAMLRGIISGLAYWYDRRPVPPTWWFSLIGQQLPLEQILILMKGDVPDSMVHTGTSYLYDPDHIVHSETTSPYYWYDPDHTTVKPGATAANLESFAAEQLVRGVLTNSGQDISNAVRSMESVLAITTAEGIQPDYSFHQHGPQLYVGGYGLGALKDLLTYATILDGTHFAFAADKIDIMSDFVLQGARLMVRGQMLDYGAIGREISRPDGGNRALRLVGVCEMLAKLRPYNDSEYTSLEQHIQGIGAPYSFLGHKHFWNSDFTVHERKGYYASVKMTSIRTNGIESLNGENLKGFWLPFGVNYIARRGDEYTSIFPVWDWAHLPGTTSPDDVPSMGSYVSQNNRFVGGVSDGVYGASAMLLDIESGSSIHAHKSWFFFDDELVALGAGISSIEPVAVTTTLNQSLLYGDVTVDNSKVPIGQHVLNNVSWVLHDGIGYVFPSKANLVLKNEPQHGSWSSINALQSKQPITENVFTLWLDHGVRPVDANYEYIIVPDVDAAHLPGYIEKIPIRILANTVNIQAVMNERLGISEMVFYAPGRLTLTKGLEVDVNQPCMVMLEESGPTAKLTVSSPEGPLRVQVTISAPGKTKIATFDLPGMEMSGTSQAKTLE